MRRELPRRFPGVEFFFQPADMVTQILNFGLPAAIDVQITGADLRANYDIAAKLDEADANDSGHRGHAHPAETRPAHGGAAHGSHAAAAAGLERQRCRRTNLLVSTAGTSQTAPAFWLNPSNGVVYNLTVQSPQYTVDSLDALLRTPVRAAASAEPRPRNCSAIWSASRRRRRRPSIRATTSAPAIDIYVERARPRPGQHFRRYPTAR